MRRLFAYGRETVEGRAGNFYRQAVFMRDYEDDCPWPGGDFVRYFPTYHDLTTQQLRGYFTWRAGVRRGEFRPIPASAAYLYLYELLNGVGADSPEDVLNKLLAFETVSGNSRSVETFTSITSTIPADKSAPPTDYEKVGIFAFMSAMGDVLS